MPCIEEWLSNPLLVIDSMSGDCESRMGEVRKYFDQRVRQQGINKIRSINEKCLDHLKPNTLVQFRCMIQDMFEPEYYLSRYETVDKATGLKNDCIGLYRDVTSCKPGHEVDMNSPNNATSERQCFYCVPVPAETTWAKKAFAKTCGVQSSVSNDSKVSTSNSWKRNYSEFQSSSVDEISTSSDSRLAKNEAEADDQRKKIKKPEENQGSTRYVEVGNADLNLPLPEETGPACIVKVYDEFESFKVNDVVVFVGVLSVDPVLTPFHGERDQNEDEVHSSLNFMEVEEQCPQSLPSSLVPRIHAVVGYKLQHSNPLLEVFSQPSCGIENLFSKVAQVRQPLLDIFQEIMYGDAIAAEYLLLHIISTIYSRPDVLALGKYTLNLTGCSGEVAQQIFQMVEFIVPKCHRFPLTISNLNKSKLVPKKDYMSNRLISGKLQLSDGTHLVVDETVLEEGQLDSNGILNISALNHLISWQKVQYDFSFYRTDFPANMVILILSEGKSLLQTDSRLPMVAQKPPVAFGKVVGNLEEGFFDAVRKYIGLARLISYEISSDIQKYVENDFVEMRQAAPGEMTVERFHSLLCLARLMAISNGRKSLLKEDWEKTRELEKQRQDRVPQGSQ